MLPFEFTITGPPVSLQTRNRQRLQSWKQEIKRTAVSNIPHGLSPTDKNVVVSITYYYDGESPDVDNIIKPIQDALNDVVYIDDEQVVKTTSGKKSIDGSFKIRGVSSILLKAFSDGRNFLHIKISEADDPGVLE